jgi:gamma-glutamyl:cysteine ligase YbdK (ATP-grasp superfamily)
MGIAIDRDRFEEEDYARFSRRLEENLEALGVLLERPGFGIGEQSIGAELEMSLVDSAGDPLMCNQELLDELDPSMFTVEIDRFNLECNSTPRVLAGTPLSSLEAELDRQLAQARAVAATRGGRVVLVGIVPTLRAEHFSGGALTDTPRFRAMNAGIRRLKGEPFQVRIQGQDELTIDVDDVSYEGANTSFQLHLRVSPDEFSASHNAAQIATVVALAAGGNSPLFLGRRLWEETRVALFKQTVDDRDLAARRSRHTPRVCFGLGWLEAGARQLFEESVRHHAPILPVCFDEDPLALARSGGLPQLTELRLHHGTVWRWNRAVYDPAAGGHLRIELRALPSGPTVRDMMASAAFLLGLTLGLRPRAGSLVAQLPFDEVHGDFYRAARRGLDAELSFPDQHGQLVTGPARELALRLLPVAIDGLRAAGVDRDEAIALMSVVEARITSGQTGACWQRRRLAALERTTSRPRALATMLDEYVQRSETGQPVHTWPLEAA